MTEQLPRHDQARREADGSEPHDMQAPARLIASRGGSGIEIECESAARAMQLAMAMLHHSDGVPDRIVLGDGSEIGTVAIRQEYERTLALGGFDER
ncbi:MAG TPA: hypothetical protein VFT04_07095 [Gemmatimonadales bacterium]|nr:hypothetical protein [Gemmatimonadales bacterium]